jgi:hypothetical protein
MILSLDCRLGRVEGNGLAQVSTGHALLTGALSEDVLDECLTSLVRGAHKRSAGAVQEAHIQSSLSPHLELIRSHILLYLKMAFGWAHVLAECNNIHVGLSKFC